MNEGIIILVAVSILGVAYFVCALRSRDICDMGKVFTLLVVAVGLVTGVFIFIHSYEVLKTNTAHYEDAVWSAVAGVILTLYSIQETLSMFREVIVKRVEPLEDVKSSRDKSAGQNSIK